MIAFFKTYKNEYLLLGLWLIVILIVNPIGDFPLNDDWCYGKSVKTLYTENYLKLYNWGEMTLVGHVYWGYFFTLIFGFSFTVLRWSVLCLGYIAIIGFYRLFKVCDFNNKTALFASVLMIANPIFMALSFSFMTDVPYLCYSVWILYFFIKVLKTDKFKYIIIASILICLSFTIRQLSWGFPLVWLITVLITERITAKRILKALMPLMVLGAFALCFTLIMDYYDVLPQRYNSKFKLLLEKLTHIDKSLIIYVILNALQVLTYLGLFLAPLFAVNFNKFRFKKYLLWVLGFTFIGFYVILRYNRVLPSFQNIWIDFGIGPTTLYDASVSFTQGPLPRLPEVLWKLVTFVGLFSSMIILLSLRKRTIAFYKKNRIKAIPIFLLLFILIYCAPFLIVGFYDRYLLILFPVTLVFVFMSMEFNPNRLKKSFTISTILAIGVFSVMATHDYLSWNRVRWRMIDDLMDSGISKNHIQGGAEFVTTYHFSEQEEEWWTNVTPIYTLKFIPLDTDVVLERQKYSRWLPGKGEICLVYNKVLDELQKQ